MRAIVAAGEIHLVVIAKAPVAGRVKTRLCPPYTLAEAAILAEAALADTLAAVAATPAAARTVVLDGAIGHWLPAGFSVIPQRGNGLDERLAAGLDDAQRGHDAPLLLIGMDTPQLTPALLEASCDALVAAGTDAVLGPATDGGWWALGLRRADSSLLVGVPMSTPQTYDAQLARLHAAGLNVSVLPELVDVDDALSAGTVAGQAPSSRFSRALAALVLAS
jgi:rSAM/selenodomain-associated transferase 1